MKPVRVSCELIARNGIFCEFLSKAHSFAKSCFRIRTLLDRTQRMNLLRSGRGLGGNSLAIRNEFANWNSFMRKLNRRTSEIGNAACSGMRVESFD